MGSSYGWKVAKNVVEKSVKFRVKKIELHKQSKVQQVFPHEARQNHHPDGGKVVNLGNEQKVAGENAMREARNKYRVV